MQEEEDLSEIVQLVGKASRVFKLDCLAGIYIQTINFCMYRMFFGLCDVIVFFFTMGALIELQGGGANFLVMKFQGGVGGPSPSSLVGGRSIKFESQNAVRVNF